jgi:hypothetical protein
VAAFLLGVLGTPLWGAAAAADVLAWRKSEFDGRLHLKASLPSAVVREGKLAYAA